MEDHQGPMVGLCSRDFKKAWVSGKSQEPSFFTGDNSPVLQVPFVPHQDNGHFHSPTSPLQLLDPLELLAGKMEAGAVTDAVDQDKAIGPVDLFLVHAALKLGRLQRSEWEPRINEE